ncbi:unnamed protein product [Parajaminaea phylloscopi]
MTDSAASTTSANPPQVAGVEPTTPQVPQPTGVFLPPNAQGSSSGSSSKSSSGSKLAERFRAAIIPTPAEEDPKPTVNELKAAYASTLERNQRLGAGPDAPLMTQSMREKHEAKFARPKKTFEEVRVRFRFPDRTQVEYQLPASTPLLSLYGVLRSSFRDSTAFTLYTSPPRQEYLETDAKLRGKRLSEMGWGAGAVVLVKWVSAPAMSPPPLRDELLKIAQPLEPPSMGMHGSEEASPAPASASASGGRTLGGDAASSQPQDKEKKMPKWLKGFKK